MLNIAAFKKQIEVLEIVEQQKKAFDLSQVIEHSASCGTVCCAFGWMATMRAWPGLTTRQDEPGKKNSAEHAVYVDDRGMEHTGFSQPLGAIFVIEENAEQDRHDYEALTHIFHPGSWWGKTHHPAGPRQVIDRIKLLLELGSEAFNKRIDDERRVALS